MKVLVACEYSGTVRDAFIRMGHDAISCDLLPTDIAGPHYQGSVFDIINNGFDLMIGHPPCTYLSYAATAYWDEPGRIQKRLDALNFFAKLWLAPIEKICLENPLGITSAVITKHSQIIHPYYFGDSDLKRTCLWLKNLPELVHFKLNTLFDSQTHVAHPEPMYVDKISGKKRYFTDGNRGGHLRSRSFQGIADAMASQWGIL